jgi:hypothetical protein
MDSISTATETIQTPRRESGQQIPPAQADDSSKTTKTTNPTWPSKRPTKTKQPSVDDSQPTDDGESLVTTTDAQPDAAPKGALARQTVHLSAGSTERCVG